MLLDFANKNLLTQLVIEPTRKNKSILDLVLTTDEDIFFDVKVETNNFDTDHDTVTCQILLENSPSCDVDEEEKKTVMDSLNFDKAKWENIKEELSLINWTEELINNLSVEKMCENLHNKLSVICARHTSTRKNKQSKVNHIPRNRLVLIRKRKRI